MHLGAEIARGLAGRDSARLETLCTTFNFGPHITSNRPVEELVGEILKHWPGAWRDLTEPNAKHEAGRLNLTIDKAYHTLGWEPRWDFAETIQHTIEWYRRYYQSEAPDPTAVQALTQGQIRAYAAGLEYKTAD